MGVNRVSATGETCEIDIDADRIVLSQTETRTLRRTGRTQEDLDTETRATLVTKYGRALPVPVFLRTARDGSVMVTVGALSR